jgi:hypothetical protein
VFWVGPRVLFFQVFFGREEVDEEGEVDGGSVFHLHLRCGLFNYYYHIVLLFKNYYDTAFKYYVTRLDDCLFETLGELDYEVFGGKIED